MFGSFTRRLDRSNRARSRAAAAIRVPSGRLGSWVSTQIKHVRRAALLTAATTVAIMLASCGATESRPNAPGPASGSATATPAPSGADGADGAVTLNGAPQPVAAGLDAPWSVAFRDHTALVSERDTGRILELRDDGAARVVGTIPGAASGGEAGLLGIAVDDQGRTRPDR
jgi:glucose/arabinose dehydrogenase